MNKIKQVFSLHRKPQSNGNIERFNATLKRNIKMIRTSKDDPNWPKYLDDIINNYNNSKHKVTNKTPHDAESSNYANTKENITKEANKRSILEQPNFHKGDYVRIKNEEGSEYNFSKDVYQIVKVSYYIY